MTKGENPMMMLQNKTLGQQFLEVLNASKEDKEKMFTLLRSTLEKVNPLLLNLIFCFVSVPLALFGSRLIFR